MAGARTTTKYSKTFKAKALELMEEHTIAVVSDVLDVPPKTLVNWRRKAGISRKPRSAQRSAANYNKAKRIEMSNTLFAELENVIKLCQASTNLRTKSNALKSAAVTFAVLTEKRRLEEGASGDGGGLPVLEPGQAPKELTVASEKRAALTAGKQRGAANGDSGDADEAK